jgi:hypothetical protein
MPRNPQPSSRTAAANSATAVVPTAPLPAPAAAAAADAEDADLLGAVVMPRMNRSNLVKYQLLFITIAHSEIRQRGTLSVAEQARLLLAGYKRNIRLWYRDDATLLSIPNMPVCRLPDYQ